MKKIISLILAIAMLWGFACLFTSCNNKKNDEQIVIRVLENDFAKKNGYLQVLLDAFNEKYKEYNVIAVDADMDGRESAVYL